MDGRVVFLVTNQQFCVHIIITLLVMHLSSGEPCRTIITRSSRVTNHDHSPSRLIPHDIVRVHTETPCSVSLCTGNGADEQVRSTEFRCHSPGLIAFENCMNHTQEFIGLTNCQLQLQTLTDLCDSPGLFQLVLRNSVILNDTEVDPGKNCLSLGVFAAVNTDLNQAVDTIFPPNQISHVFRLQLFNASLAGLHIAQNFTQRFPYLNFLDLSNNSWRTFPDLQCKCFPHGSIPSYQRRNSLSKQFNSEFGLGLQPNVTPNILVLDYNYISHLHNVSLGPCLHALSLVGNGIPEIDQNVFTDLYDLRHLNLSKNVLKEIPTICSGESVACELRVLDLSYNEIKTIPANSFTELRELRLLHLAGNSLSVLSQNAFSKLNALEEVHLEFNRLTFLDTETLPCDTAFLKDVYLHHNPINHIPASVLQLPGLRYIDLSHCDITLDTLQETLEKIDIVTWLQSLLKEFTTRIKDIKIAKEMASKRQRPYARFINLSNNNITSIPAPSMFRVKRDEVLDLELKFKLFLVNLQLNLSTNPISCDSNIGDFVIYMQNHSADIGDGTFQGNEYFYQEWKCSSPIEFRGSKILSLHPRHLYQENRTLTCPLNCSCYSFYRDRGVMVQCENQALSDFPLTIPERTIDLRLGNNNIGTIRPGSGGELLMLESLSLSNNSLKEIPPTFLPSLANLLLLALDHNALQTLPREITSLTNVSKFWLANNPYICDCKNFWLKEWLTENNGRVVDIDNMFCRKHDNTVSQFLSVGDSQFICPPKKSNVLYWVSIGVAVGLVGIITCSLCVYIFRLELRSLVYSWNHVRLLDSPKSPAQQEAIKTLVLVAEEETEFCEDHVLPLLQRDSTNDCVVLFRDYIAGLTHGDNISILLKHSYRIVVLVSNSLLTDEWRVLALHKILLKARIKPELLVLLTLENEPESDRVDSLSELKRFYKTNRYYCIRSSDRLWKKKITYLCNIKDNLTGFSVEQNWLQRILSPAAERPRSCTHDIFIAHHDSDYLWVMNELRAKLQESDFSIQMPDLDFIPGVDIQDNMLNSVAKCRYVLLVLSVAFLASEWAVFILRHAYETTLSENSNSLIVIKTEPLPPIEDQDLSVYLRTHAYVDLSDPDWWRKLEGSLWRAPSRPVSDIQLALDSVSFHVGLSEQNGS